MSKTPAGAPTVPITTLVGAMPDHPRAVLYTCHTNTATAAQALADLRDVADAHRWPVVHEVYDLASPALPRRRRIGWCTLEQLVLRDATNTVIAPAEREIAWTQSERITLRAWLRGVSGCALCPQAGFPRACAPVRPEGRPA
ncbi:hypothetical protein [Streptomyces sp. NPDC051214]|uniref:hypothetical protein n=1 Tax=Streptomyces sp. NPDC051214 TaxID=3155282 RepID=UPI003442B4F5